MNRNDMGAQFYEGKRSEDIPFVINDAVEILTGAGKGKKAAVISITPTDDGVSYLVEPGDGSSDLVIAARSLKLI